MSPKPLSQTIKLLEEESYLSLENFVLLVNLLRSGKYYKESDNEKKKKIGRNNIFSISPFLCFFR